VATLRDELASGTQALAQAGCDSPRLDAELLLAEVLGTDRAGLVTASSDHLSGDQRTRYMALLTRRAMREPVAYILGRREFRRLSLAVDPRVLIPRPETELLVEVGLELPFGARVADVGTGSGAVALALKDERPDLAVTGIDRDRSALAVARGNAQRTRLDVRWVEDDLLDDTSVYDAVLANLPYVRDGEPLPKEVSDFEPASALFAGADGLDPIRRLVGVVGARRDVALLALEIGAEQGDAVAELVSGAGFGSVQRRLDLAGLERVIVARR
jgi:release factor glutamine methyltransferase